MFNWKERYITWWRLKQAFRFTRRPTSPPSLSSPGARNCLLSVLSPWGGHMTHDHQLRHLLHRAELRLGNTIWTKPMWAVVFYDWNIFVGWDNTENIFIGGCEVYEGMIGNRPAEDQVLLGLSRNVGGWGAGHKTAVEGERNLWLHHPVSSIYHPCLLFLINALHRLLEIPLSGYQEEAAWVGRIRQRISWRIIERRNICEPLFLVHKEPAVIDWRLYVPCYIFISILIINIENEKYKYSSFKETWADLIYNEHSSDPSTVVKAHCMAGILTRDTTN